MMNSVLQSPALSKSAYCLQCRYSSSLLSHSGSISRTNHPFFNGFRSLIEEKTLFPNSLKPNTKRSSNFKQKLVNNSTIKSEFVNFSIDSNSNLHKSNRDFITRLHSSLSSSSTPTLTNTENGSAKIEVEKSAVVNGLIDFLNASWTPFHATDESKRMLLSVGFEQLNEKAEWSLKSGGRYFFTRNMSSIVAFTIGKKYTPGDGFYAIGAHTDSPCLKLKPVSSYSKNGFLSIGVQTYGGGLWHTWFDRDLSVAGRVLLRLPAGGLEHRLVRISRPIIRVPTLAIHLDRTVNTDGFKPNLENHLGPILATHIKNESFMNTFHSNDNVNDINMNHHPLLLKMLADELGCKADDIVDFELNVCDTQPSVTAGALNEFVFSGRLDNLASSYCALKSIIDSSASEEDLEEERGVRMIALFDHEEVGSESAQGAGSSALYSAMKRTVKCLTKNCEEEGLLMRSLQRSFIVSADMAHAVHPNYGERHEEKHQPKIHGGLVIKQNANQRYATNLVSAVLFKELAKKIDIPTQNFVVRNDMGCGSTIGPILAASLGIRTVDVGMPQLSMHSIREMCGTDDIFTSYLHFRSFFENFSKIDDKLIVD